MNNERNFSVYFELYGKKMKKVVLAKSEDEAKQKVKNDIIFHKVTVNDKDAFNAAMNVMDDILNHLK